MKFTMASKCIHNRGGMCYFLMSEPQPCSMCVNFVSADPVILKELKIKKSVVSYYDMVIADPRYRAMFPQSDNEVQLSLSDSRTYELPDDED